MAESESSEQLGPLSVTFKSLISPEGQETIVVKPATSSKYGIYRPVDAISLVSHEIMNDAHRSTDGKRSQMKVLDELRVTPCAEGKKVAAVIGHETVGRVEVVLGQGGRLDGWTRVPDNWLMPDSSQKTER